MRTNPGSDALQTDFLSKCLGELLRRAVSFGTFRSGVNGGCQGCFQGSPENSNRHPVLRTTAADHVEIRDGSCCKHPCVQARRGEKLPRSITPSLTFPPHRQDTAVDVSMTHADTHRRRQLHECVDISHSVFCWAGFTGGDVGETQG